MQNIHNHSTRCPKCGKLLISPFGHPDAKLLLVGDFPGYRETIERIPFTFRKPKPGYRLEAPRSGDVLKDELNRVGISLNDVLLTNLWQHQQDWKIEIIPPKTSRGKPKEKKVHACPPEWHLDQLVRMFTGKTHVLLMGSDVTQALIGEKVGAVSGLRVDVPGFEKISFWVSPNPSLVMSQPIGEFRLALQRFADDVRTSTEMKKKGKKKIK